MKSRLCVFAARGSINGSTKLNQQCSVLPNQSSEFIAVFQTCRFCTIHTFGRFHVLDPCSDGRGRCQVLRLSDRDLACLALQLMRSSHHACRCSCLCLDSGWYKKRVSTLHDTTEESTVLFLVSKGKWLKVANTAKRAQGDAPRPDSLTTQGNRAMELKRGVDECARVLDSSCEWRPVLVPLTSRVASP